MDPVTPVLAEDIPENLATSLYPEPFASLMSGRTKRKLGDFYGLSNFGINLTELLPGAMSALKHHHLKQDEFIYIINGTLTLIYGEKEYLIKSGECFGFAKGLTIGHQLINHSNEAASYLEIGDRTKGDQVEYPDNDLQAISNEDGSWAFLHKDNSPY